MVTQNELTWKAYQDKTAETANYPSENGANYCMEGFVGEVGEIADKLKKLMRGDTETSTDDVLAEVGDALWYSARLAYETGFDDLDGITLRKLSLRKSMWVNMRSGQMKAACWREEATIRLGHLQEMFRSMILYPQNEAFRFRFIGLLGDVIYCLAQIAHVFCSTLNKVALMNLEKLKSRKERGTIQGNGDNR